MSRTFAHLVAAHAAAARGYPGLPGIAAALFGIVATLVIGLRYLIRPPTKERIPETLTPARFTVRSFQSSRGQMVYHEGGLADPAAPALVFIHNVGVGASSYDWSKVYPAFAESHRVLAVDLLGFGESERPKAQLSAVDYAEALADFVGSLSPDEGPRPAVIARGLGAGFVALMAARHPDAAGRLLLWMPSGRAHVPALLRLASRLPILNSYIYRNRLARRATIRARFAAPGAFVDPAAITTEMIEVHALCAQQYQADYAIFRLLQGKLDFDLEARWREVAAPAALLWPERVPPESTAEAQRLQAANRRSTLRVLPGTGPFAPMEAPEALVGVLREELAAEAVMKAG